MDPQAFSNIGQHSATPAPMWFIEFFKVLGFVLHSIPMNLWYAGLIIAVALLTFGGREARLFAGRFLRQMPIIIAFGVNLGVVPLLFTQTAYYQFFYPATILMAWFWLSIIGLVILAYYGVYAYAWGLKSGENVASWRVYSGWAAAVFFMMVGFVFANAFSLMAHVQNWKDLWNAHQTAGAATGTALNLGDVSLWPRWLLMFGLAQTTTAVWVLVDLAVFFKKADENYKKWVWAFSKKLYTHGMIWAAIAGAWYVFGTWPKEVHDVMFGGPTMVLTVLTGLATGLPWLLIFSEKMWTKKLPLVIGIFLAQVGVMALNGVSRQIVQNISIDHGVKNVTASNYGGILQQATETQWGAMTLFLVVFVIGVGVLAWMIGRVVKETAS